MYCIQLDPIYELTRPPKLYETYHFYIVIAHELIESAYDKNGASKVSVNNSVSTPRTRYDSPALLILTTKKCKTKDRFDRIGRLQRTFRACHFDDYVAMLYMLQLLGQRAIILLFYLW